MLDGPCGDGPGFVKGIIPMINAETLDLVGIDQGVIQFGATTEGFINDQNVGLPSHWIVPGSGAGHDWHI